MRIILRCNPVPQLKHYYCPRTPDRQGQIKIFLVATSGLLCEPAMGTTIGIDYKVKAQEVKAEKKRAELNIIVRKADRLS
jgi:hypothetical protein